MSKIGKRIILIPEGVTVREENGRVYVKGPKGELSMPFSSEFSLNVADKDISIVPKNPKRIHDKKNHAMWGLSRALIQNMIIGVTGGFEKKLEFQGVGYKAVVAANELKLELGYSHPVTLTAPEGISFKVEKSSITVMGIDKELVGKVAADIRSCRKPEPYKGSGIRYADEIIRRKVGKKAATAGA